MVQEEFGAELPVDADGSDATGTGPLASDGADFDARLTMRDVILIKRGSKVKVGKTRKGHFDTRYEPKIGGLITLPVDRGWASVEASVGKRKFRFVNTHLEAFGDPKIREAQAKELTKGPLKTKTQVVLVGDLNSGIGRHNEPEKPGDDLAFKALDKFGLKDNGARQSCCFGSLFDPNATFDHTVDHVLTKPGLTTTRIRDRQRRGGADRVRALAVGPRRRRQPGAAAALGSLGDGARVVRAREQRSRYALALRERAARWGRSRARPAGGRGDSLHTRDDVSMRRGDQPGVHDEAKVHTCGGMSGESCISGSTHVQALRLQANRSTPSSGARWRSVTMSCA